MSSDIDSIVKAAIGRFKADNGVLPNDLRDMKVTSLLDLQRVLHDQQQKQCNNRKQKFLRRLKPFLDTMEQYSKAINVLGPMKFLLIAASNFTEAYDFLLELYEEIGESILLLERVDDAFKLEPHVQSALGTVYADILDFHLEAVKLFSKNIFKQIFAAVRRGLHNKIEKLSKSLRRHTHLVNTHATVSEYRNAQIFRDEIREEIKFREQDDKHQRRMRVVQWLGPISATQRHEDVAKDRFADTGQWLIDDQRFQKWFSLDQCIDPLLWLHGIPGAGKTVLAWRVIEEVKKLPKTSCLYFYCQYLDQRQKGLLTIIKSLLAQIITTCDATLHLLYQVALSSSEVVLSEISIAKDLLEKALKSCGVSYIVLDGLDEYERDDRKEISLWFQNFVNDVPKFDLGTTRCLFVSQEDGFARKDFSMLSQIKITKADTENDISKFCGVWHQRIEEKFGETLTAKNNVQEIVTTKSEGMFLFAKLVTSNLYEQVSYDDFEAEMKPNNFPEGLEDAYAKILGRILGPKNGDGRRQNRIKELLGWLACTRRPLKWREIQCCICLNLDEGRIEPGKRYMEHPKDLCSSLVDLSSDKTVTLVHSTAKAYLSKGGFIKLDEAELDLARRCLVCLTTPDLHACSDETRIDNAVSTGQFAFAEYAVWAWTFHLETALSDSVATAGEFAIEVVEYLDEISMHYWETPEKAIQVSRTLEEKLKLLQHHTHFGTYCQMVYSWRKTLRPSTNDSVNKQPLRLLDWIQSFRQRIEDLASTTTRLPEYYGDNLFKCPRPSCHYFVQGFKTNQQRENHVNKHERSFMCLEDGCPYSYLGFPSIKELEKHGITAHGLKPSIDTVVQPEFPQEPQPAPSVEAKPKETPKEHTERPVTKLVKQVEFRQPKKVIEKTCRECQKTFTRTYNYRSHMRAHTNDRPYGCNQCDKAFARKSDLQRHTSMHINGKQEQCHGYLQSGDRWGCGRKFGRADALSEHFRSNAGYACIAPAIQESFPSDEFDCRNLTPVQWAYIRRRILAVDEERG